MREGQLVPNILLVPDAGKAFGIMGFGRGGGDRICILLSKSNKENGVAPPPFCNWCHLVPNLVIAVSANKIHVVRGANSIFAVAPPLPSGSD